MKPGPKPRPRVPCVYCRRPKPEGGVCKRCAKENKRRDAGILPRTPGFSARCHSAKHHYGLTPSQLGDLEARHGGLCAICKQPPAGKRALHIDHDHSSGQVRGLLCHHCNVGLGSFRDRPDLLAAAIAYLAR